MSRPVQVGVFIVLVVSAFLGWQWPWGLLFLYWTVPSVISGQAFLLGPVQRDKDPIFFWAIVLVWALFGALMIAADIFPGLTRTYLR